jgi:hypothetical protein
MCHEYLLILPLCLGIISGPPRPGRKRSSPHDIEGEDDVRQFKRVRLIAKRQRIKSQPFSTTGSLKTFSTFTGKPTANEHLDIVHTQSSAPSQTAQSFEDKTAPSVEDPIPDIAEIVKQELEKARREGLLSKTAPSEPKPLLEEMTPKPASHVADKEYYWESKWHAPKSYFKNRAAIDAFKNRRRFYHFPTAEDTVYIIKPLDPFAISREINEAYNRKYGNHLNTRPYGLLGSFVRHIKYEESKNGM